LLYWRSGILFLLLYKYFLIASSEIFDRVARSWVKGEEDSRIRGKKMKKGRQPRGTAIASLPPRKARP